MATDKESLMVEATAPDIDAQARLLEEAVELLAEVRPRDCGAHYCRYCPAKSPEWTHDLHCLYVESQQAAERASRLRKRLVNALPALLATARRERRMREAMRRAQEELRGDIDQHAIEAATGVVIPAIDRALAHIDAALAEEGQDG